MGFGAVRKQQAEFGRSGGGGQRGEYVKELKLRDKDSVTLLFVGPTSEPHLRDAHRCVNVTSKFSYETCAGEGCGFCDACIRGDRRVNKAQSRASFNVYVLSKVHLVQAISDKTGEAIVTKKGEPILNDVFCRGKKCKLCADGDTAEVMGHRRLELSTMYAAILGEKLAEESRYAEQGWVPDETQRVEVERVAWLCSSCGAKYKEKAYSQEQFDFEVKVTCAKCSEEVTFLEVLAAEGIDDPTRITLQSGAWKITRYGADTSTTYAFEFRGVSEMPPEVEGLNPVDFAQFHAARSPKKIAELIGGGARPIARSVGTGGKPASKSAEYTDYSDDEEEVRTLAASTTKPTRANPFGR